MSANISMKEITKVPGKIFWLVTEQIFFSYMESGPGGMFWTKERHRAPPGTPRKSGFSARKSPKEGERVARRHFHERVGESPRREKNFGTSGSKIRRFVSEIWPFEVGIGVRAD